MGGNIITERLISYIEKNEQIKAPPNMKNEIMLKVRSENTVVSKKPKSKESRLQLFYYSVKVGIVASMALIAVFSMSHVNNAEITGGKWGDFIVSQMNEKTNHISSGLVSVSNQILKMEVLKNAKKEK